ncbi:MAG: TetR/AcrR family transcriptional regulator, partial [Planctomycetaceae bacterium]|nr:TetR/AcrR family transcriptional regulator [Planctomycetaceae bacterium]
MPSLRARKKEQTHQKILRCCERLFRTQGYDETTIEQIVESAQVSRKTFFNYFSTKDAALAELGIEWLTQQGARAREGVQEHPPTSLIDGLKRFQRNQFEAIEQDREFMKLVFTRSAVFFPHGDFVGTDSDQTRLAGTKAFFGNLALLFRTAQLAGQVRSDVTAEQIAEIYVGAMLV